MNCSAPSRARARSWSIWKNVTEAELARYCEEFRTLHLHYAQLLSKRGGKIQATAASAEFDVESGANHRLPAKPAKD